MSFAFVLSAFLIMLSSYFYCNSGPHLFLEWSFKSNCNIASLLLQDSL